MNTKEIITREHVLEVEKRLFSAQLESNVSILDELLHDDLIAMAPNGELITKAMDLEAHRMKTMVIEDATSEIEEIKLIGDSAVAVVKMVAKGKMMGNPLSGTFKYLRIWKSFDGKLKVIGVSIFLMPN